jgi:hypothetical protein
MKTHSIELQRIKGMSSSHGLVKARVDALVQTSAGRDGDDEAGSTLTLTMENARVLFLLLKAQLAQADPPKGRSQR